MTRALRGLAVVALLLGLSGCAGERPAPEQGRPSASLSAQQVAALKDDDVTWDEYKAAFDAYAACLDRKGVRLTDVRVENDLFTFGVPGAAVDSGVDDQCYAFNWSRVDEAWQTAHQDTSESAQIVKACLRSRGVAPLTDYRENLDLLRRNGISIADCTPG